MKISITNCNQFLIVNDETYAATITISVLQSTGLFDPVITLASIPAGGTLTTVAYKDMLYKFTWVNPNSLATVTAYTPILCGIDKCQLALIRAIFCDTDTCNKNITLDDTRRHIKFRDLYTVLSFDLKTLMDKQSLTLLIQPPVTRFQSMYQIFTALITMCYSICDGSLGDSNLLNSGSLGCATCR